MKLKEPMAESPATWLGMIPSHWKVKKLKFAAELRTDRLTSPPAGLRYVGLEHIESKMGRFAPVAADMQTEAESTVNCFRRGDVLFGKLRPYLAKAVVADSDGCCSSEILVFRALQANPGYLKHVVLLDGFIQAVNASTFGSKMPRADAAFISQMVVSLPPTEEQDAIVSYLDVETARIDSLIAEKKKLVEALLELKKSVVHEAITMGVRKAPKLTESRLSWISKIPKHWKTASLKRCVRLVGGHTPSTTNVAYWDGSIPWFSPKDMKSDELADSIDHVTDAAVSETGLSLIEPGTTMIVVRGMILAHTFPVCVTKVQGTLNQDMKALVPDETLDKLYLPWLLRGVASLFLSLTDQSGHGTMALRTDSFMSERLPIPPLDEQLEIVAHLDAERRRIDRLLAHVRAELDLLAELRSSTITDAVLGRIDVRAVTQNKKELEAA